MSDFIKLSKQGTPFATEAAAKAQLKREGLDESRYVVMKYQGGWAIGDLEGLQSGAVKQAEVAANQDAARKKMKYRKVRWHAKRHANDEEDVVLGCDGNVLIFQREKEVIVPESHMEVARNAFHHQFVEVPGEMRKERGPKIYKYAWEDLGEATEEDFQKQLRQGREASGIA